MAQHTNAVKEFIVRQYHTAFSCRDWEKTKSFFVDLLGFKVLGEMERRDEAKLSTVTGLPPGAACRWAMLELEGYHIELFKWLSPEGKPIDIRQCDIGLTHICFQVNNAEAVRERMMAAGYEPLSEVQDLRGGRAKPFYCRGPEGVVVEFVEYPFGA
jgi:catechol 2,3-dioxygenase-like lactoylglutathione lyase family enzyme